jgi:hypothetical protein
MTADFMAAERRANDERDRKLRGHADPDCSLCRGEGQTGLSPVQSPTPQAPTPCPCTGYAAYQAGPCPEIPEPAAQSTDTEG